MWNVIGDGWWLWNRFGIISHLDLYPHLVLLLKREGTREWGLFHWKINAFPWSTRVLDSALNSGTALSMSMSASSSSARQLLILLLFLLASVLHQMMNPCENFLFYFRSIGRLLDWVESLPRHKGSNLSESPNERGTREHLDRKLHCPICLKEEVKKTFPNSNRSRISSSVRWANRPTELGWASMSQNLSLAKIPFLIESERIQFIGKWEIN